MADNSVNDNNVEPFSLHINDDCFLEILSWLPLLDLCSIRNTCSRLRALTDYYIERSSTYSSLDFQTNKIKKNEFEMINKNEIIRLLSTFELHIDALTLDAHKFSADVTDLMPILDAFCARRHLQHLTLINFNIDEIIKDHPQRFANVKHLSFSNCFAPAMVKVRVKLTESCFTRTFPMLQGLSIEKCGFSQDLIQAVISKNRQLSELRICNCYNLRESIFKAISDHLADLEILTFTEIRREPIHRFYWLQLLKLEKLRQLEIDGNSTDIPNLLKALGVKNKLESLGLYNVRLSAGACHAIGMMGKLQKFKLVKSPNLKSCARLKSIIAQLSNLEHLEMVSSASMSFEDIIEIFENSSKLVDITISGCENVRPFSKDHLDRLKSVCAKRATQTRLTIRGRVDLYHFYTIMRAIEIIEQTERKSSEFLESWLNRDDVPGFYVVLRYVYNDCKDDFEYRWKMDYLK